MNGANARATTRPPGHGQWPFVQSRNTHQITAWGGSTRCRQQTDADGNISAGRAVWGSWPWSSCCCRSRGSTESSLGLTWRLDRRLHVGGQALDPPGHWSWLTVGRPALVGELLWQRVAKARDPGARSIARDLRKGSVNSRPAHTESVAAAVGLRRAGQDVTLTVRVTVSVPEPGHTGLPQRAVLTRINGVAIEDRESLRHALDAAAAREGLSFQTEAGEHHVLATDDLPYQHMEIVDLAPDVEAAVGGQGPPYSWIRSMSMGSSHGLMVGLTTYAAVTDEDLAAGRHIAGTGRLFGDGTVGSIGGLKAKAGAARRSGADVLLYPASQTHLLATFDPGSMRLVPVTSLDEAIAALVQPAS